MCVCVSMCTMAYMQNQVYTHVYDDTHMELGGNPKRIRFLTKYLKISAGEMTVSLSDIGEFQICILNTIGSYVSLQMYQNSSISRETLKLLEEEEEETLQNRGIGKDV